MQILGLDIGSNSVGSAWVNTEAKEIAAGVSVFPAGVDETEDKRGAPKNQDRREKRSVRRNLARRAQRKRALRRTLVDYGLFPADAAEQQDRFNKDPWTLRCKGLDESLEPFDFGRVLIHLSQRRGTMGLKLPEPDDADESGKEDQAAQEDAKIKAAVGKTKQRMAELKARSFGALMMKEIELRSRAVVNHQGKQKTYVHQPIRNRLGVFEFHADRSMIHEEFTKLWDEQSKPGYALSHLDETRREELKRALDDPRKDDTWRHKGVLFGQRNTYWDTGTLGRCDLEPTDRCVPIADRHASYFRVVESANNIRIEKRGESERPLTPEELDHVIAALRSQKTGSIATVRRALKINKKADKAMYTLNIERDEDREINTDWFHRSIVHGVIGEGEWNGWPEKKKEGLNRALLKCDPAIDDDTERLVAMVKRMGLNEQGIEPLVEAWKSRPKLERRLSLSRRAILNLLPYMEEADFNGSWPTQINARQLFAADGENGADDAQRRRYRLGAKTLSSTDRHYLKKHPNELPPAPMLSNPVVRKAVHEVRRHVMAHMRAHGGKKPDRISIEFAREAKKPKQESDWILTLNRKRARIRKNIVEEVVKAVYGNRFASLSFNQLERAVDRVILVRQQKQSCAYSGNKFGAITDCIAAKGDGLEIDHIIPYSRCGNNSWSNLVLCWQKSNRDKGKQTPREWWQEDFDNHIRPMEFMRDHQIAKGDPNAYFTRGDYAAKWKNFNREDVPKQWKGSQLSDTAYAARQMQTYLQAALWPDEPSHLEGGPRRIFVTKGSYTHQLRKDWQLFHRLIDTSQQTQKQVRQASAKDRGDHREHAVDAVAVALTVEPGSVKGTDSSKPSTRIDDLAHHQQAVEEARYEAKSKGGDPRHVKRQPLDPPWGRVAEFRRQVMGLIYGEFDELDHSDAPAESACKTIVVCHRPIGRRITGAFHEDTHFGPVPQMKNTYIGRKSVLDLSPAHLRLRVPETTKESIERLSKKYLDQGVESTQSKARKRAKALVESAEFEPPLVDPPPRKSGLVRDYALRQRLRKCISKYQYEEKTKDGTVKRSYTLDPDKFTSKEIKQAVEHGAFCHQSGVPIKRVRLLRTMTDPVIVHRKRWDPSKHRWLRDTGKDGVLRPEQRSRADRAYVGGNNHHIEIRADEKGKWSGVIVPMFEVAKRVRIEKCGAIDCSDDPERGGRFVMSLSEGETVYMRHKDHGYPDHFVVFKLDKPQKIQFKHHWDARRAVGEKDDDSNLIDDSEREAIPVSATQLRELAPPGYDYPVKVHVDPLGQTTVMNHD